MKYDLVIVFKPDIEPKDSEKKFLDILEKMGFAVETKDWWGKKRLTYPIKKQTEGQYLAMVINSASAKPLSLNTRFKMEDEILRFLVLKKKEGRRK